MSDIRLLKSLERLSSILARLERQVATRNGVSVSQLRILQSLGQREVDDPVSVSDIATDQGLAVSTMTRNLALLQRRGWLERQTSRKDKRVVEIRLTQTGRELAGMLQENTSGRFRQAFRDVHPSESVEQAVALGKVATALEGVDGIAPTVQYTASMARPN